MPASRASSLLSLLLLSASLGACLWLRLRAERPLPQQAASHPNTPDAWLRLANSHLQADRPDDALAAARAGLLLEPWHPALSLLITQTLLRADNPDPLRAWMDELTLGDARLAEQFFDLPEFAPLLSRPDFQALHREARFQARD